MPLGPFNLAIETSSAVGGITLGRGDDVLGHATLPPPQRHRLDLIPTIDSLCRNHDVAPTAIGTIYVSIGPGSFTGLRLAVTTAKMFAFVCGTKSIAVPTLDVVAQNIAPDNPQLQDQKSDRVFESRPLATIRNQIPPTLAVCLNLKRDTVYAGLYKWGEAAGDKLAGWQPLQSPAVATLDQLLSQAPRPLWLVGHPLPPPGSEGEERSSVVRLDPALAQPTSAHLWELGRQAEKRGESADPWALLPLYVREPEAVELWNRRHGRETEDGRQKTE